MKVGFLVEKVGIIRGGEVPILVFAEINELTDIEGERAAHMAVDAYRQLVKRDDAQAKLLSVSFVP